MQADILIINKIDLAPYVGASLDVMESDTKVVRGNRPYILTNCKTGQLGVLRQRLNDAGLSVTDLDCHQGTPPAHGHTLLEQRWVDETA